MVRAVLSIAIWLAVSCSSARGGGIIRSDAGPRGRAQAKAPGSSRSGRPIAAGRRAAAVKAARKAPTASARALRHLAAAAAKRQAAKGAPITRRPPAPPPLTEEQIERRERLHRHAWLGWTRRQAATLQEISDQIAQVFDSGAALVRPPGVPPEGVARAQAPEEVCVPDAISEQPLAEDPAFQAQVASGRRASASKGIVFAGLVRDIGNSATALFAALRAAGSSFARYHIIVLENNSQDGTGERLSQECHLWDSWCFRLDVLQMARQKQEPGNRRRIENLVLLRHSLLQQVRRLVSTSPDSWHFVLMFDGDMFAGGSQGFHPSTLDALLGARAPLPAGSSDGEQTLFAEAPLDVVCANQLANWPHPGRYRDTFGLRNNTFMQYWHDGANETLEKLYFKGNRFIKLKSCFSGLALYSVRALMESGCNYTFEGEWECEHVVFNRCLSDSGFGRMALYPPLALRVNDTGVVSTRCAKLAQAEDLSLLQAQAAGPGRLEVWQAPAAQEPDLPL